MAAPAAVSGIGDGRGGCVADLPIGLHWLSQLSIDIDPAGGQSKGGRSHQRVRVWVERVARCTAAAAPAGVVD